MTLDDALELAVDVLRDYQDDAPTTRLPSLARFLAQTLGGEGIDHVYDDGTLTARQCRELAVWLLRRAEELEG